MGKGSTCPDNLIPRLGTCRHKPLEGAGSCPWARDPRGCPSLWGAAPRSWERPEAGESHPALEAVSP